MESMWKPYDHMETNPIKSWHIWYRPSRPRLSSILSTSTISMTVYFEYLTSFKKSHWKSAIKMYAFVYVLKHLFSIYSFVVAFLKIYFPYCLTWRVSTIWRMKFIWYTTFSCNITLYVSFVFYNKLTRI